MPQSVPQVKIIHQPMDGPNRFVGCMQHLNMSYIKKTCCDITRMLHCACLFIYRFQLLSYIYGLDWRRTRIKFYKSISKNKRRRLFYLYLPVSIKKTISLKAKEGLSVSRGAQVRTCNY